MIDFVINDFLTLKLEDDITNIYVDGQLFRHCKHLMLNIPKGDTGKFKDIDSIDEAAEILGWTENGQVGVKYEIDPETEFWGHSSNLQAWFEHNYDTRILYSNLAFPLLKRLTEVGDPIAKKVFKEEIVKRVESGYQPVIDYLLIQGYLKLLDVEEIKAVNADIIIEWILSDDVEELSTEIYENLVIMGNLIIKPISRKIKQSITEKSFRFIYPFISYEFVEMLQKDILSAIFWANETRYLESVIDLGITLKINHIGFELVSIMKKVGGQAFNLITKILKLPLDDEWEYLPKRLEKMALKIYEPLKEVFFGMIKNGEEIPYEYWIVFFKVLLKIIKKRELEEVILKSNVIETILKPDFYVYDLINDDPLETISKIDRSALRDKLIEFFLSPNNEVIYGIVKHYGFSYLLEKEILNIEDWKIIVENPNHNFFQVLTNATDRYSSTFNGNITLFLRDNLSSLATLLKNKIIESFNQDNLNAVKSINRLDLFFYFSERELESLIKRFYKIFISVEEASKPYIISGKMKEIFKSDVRRYENVIYEFLEEEHDALSMLNAIEMLQGDGYLRYLNDSRLLEISKSNRHIELLLEQLSHKRTDINPKLAIFLNEIEKFVKLKFRKCELDKNNRSIGDSSPLQFSVKNGKIFYLKVSSGDLDDGLFLKLFELIEKVSPTLEILVLNSNLASTLPEPIAKFPNLKILNLDNNLITMLGASIGNYSSLEELLVSSNVLASLPESIGKLKSLKTMRLSNNRINSLPDSISNLEALEDLLLDNNRLWRLPKSMGNLGSLRYLSLERNPISNLPDSFASLSSLEVLDISNTNIKQFPPFMSKIDSFRRITVSPSYRDNLIGLRKLVHPFKENDITVSFGFNHNSHFYIAYPNSITMKDLFYGNYTNHF